MTTAFASMIAKRTLHYCPACGDRLDDDDMDTGRGWKHSQAMRDRYHGVCCNACTDAHRMSEDGVLLAPGEGVQDSDGLWWSSEEALAEAEENAADEYFTRRVSKGWM